MPLTEDQKNVVEKNIGLAYWAARWFHRRTGLRDGDELLSLGHLALCDAVRTLRPGGKLSTVVGWRCRALLSDRTAYLSRAMRRGVTVPAGESYEEVRFALASLDHGPSRADASDLASHILAMMTPAQRRAAEVVMSGESPNSTDRMALAEARRKIKGMGIAC